MSFWQEIPGSIPSQTDVIFNKIYLFLNLIFLGVSMKTLLSFIKQYGWCMIPAGVFFATAAVAQGTGAEAGSLGEVAERVTTSFTNVAKLITAGAYVAGMGFAVTAVLKFKAHKDNPTQVPIGTPIALVFIAAALLFLPELFKISGITLFGADLDTAGPGGTELIPGLGGN